MKADERALSRLEEHLGRLLVTGVIVSATVLLVGLTWYFVDAGSAVSHTFLVAGLFVLMATPMLRVVVSFSEYVRMKDWFFVATTLVVMGVLALSVAFALLGR
jgi:uncharacterized membrane protein